MYFVYSSVTGTVAFQLNTETGEETSYLTLGPVTARYNGATFERWVLNDHLGSAVASINGPTGAYEGGENFTPFGEARYNPYLNWDKPSFTGHVSDSATGLTYMQARFYDPVIGRFLSTDPIDYADQLNLYAYVANDPVNKIDPTGMRRDGPYPGTDFSHLEHVRDGLETDREAKEELARHLADANDKLASAFLTVGDCLLGGCTGEGAMAMVVIKRATTKTALKFGDDGLPMVAKTVNSKMAHATERAVEHGVFASAKEAKAGLQALSTSIKKNGFPAGSIMDTARADRVLVPVGEGGMAAYQVGANGTAKLKTVLKEIVE